MNIESIPLEESPEEIGLSALEVRGELFTGLHHADAWNKIFDKHPEWRGRIEDHEIREGFMTSKGRFVDREEGHQIAEEYHKRASLE